MLQQALKWSVDASGIDRARILRGWTRRELAQRAHVDEGTLCDLFAGRRRPTFGTLRAICAALELSLQDVIGFCYTHLDGVNEGIRVDPTP
jgi:transcriptional regulator with XRE-family HTH domain